MTSSARLRHPSRRLLPALAVGAAVALSGCQVMSPLQTDVPYIAADGVPVDLGTVQVRNLVIVSEAKDGPGTITGAVRNSGNSVETVTFTVNGATAKATIDPHSEVSLSMGAGKVTIDSVPVAPGAMADVQVSTAQSGATPAQVPVLPPDRYYKSMAPSGG